MAIIHDDDHKEKDGGGEAQSSLSAMLGRIHALAAQGDAPAALALCHEALWLAPDRGDLLALGAKFASLSGDWRTTLSLAQRWVRAEPESADAYLALGDVQQALGNMAAAQSAWRRYRSLDPEDSAATAQRAEEAKGQSQEPTPAYVAALFDGYAKDFDAALARLDYHGPEILRQALGGLLPAQQQPSLAILDLGCGTGLAGVVFKPWAASLVGVDLSREMLDLAAARSLYDALHRREFLAFLREDQGLYDLIVAADSLIYTGDLADLFQAVAGRLAPRGAFAATAERLDDHEAAFRLQPTRRYAHSRQHLTQAAEAAGLKITLCEHCVTRTERHQPVQGFVFVMTRG